MINIEVDNRGSSRQVHITGHAMTAPHGEDLVCAAVSGLVQGVAFYLQKKKNTAIIEPGNVLVFVPWSDNDGLAALEAMITGLKQMETQWPEIIRYKELGVL